MGLDITFQTDINDIVFDDEYYEEKNDYFHKHSLSRTFYNLLCRKDVVEGESELDQIARLTSVDVSPIYQMETYGSENEEELESFLEMAESDEEREKIRYEDQLGKDQLKNNITGVLGSVELLINRLSDLHDLPSQLNDNGWDSLGNHVYFTNFPNDPGDGYLRNNFGQDLRNFRRFLHYAMDKGATTVYFVIG